MKQEDIKNMDDSTRFTMNDEDEVKLDDLAVVATTPENVAWGEWNEEAEETNDSSSTTTSQGGVSVTDPDVIVNATHTATYNGKISGTHFNGTTTGDIIDNADNIFEMKVKFGTNKIEDGQIGAHTTLGTTGNNKVDYSFTGTVRSDGTGFDIVNGNGPAANPGTGSGKFYGSNGNIVKGSLDFNGSGIGGVDLKTQAEFNGTSN